MSLNQAIASGWERRAPYYGSAQDDRTCRPHGSCPYCRDNRLHAARVRMAAAASQLRDWWIGQDTLDDEREDALERKRETLLQRFIREMEEDLEGCERRYQEYLTWNYQVGPRDDYDIWVWEPSQAEMWEDHRSRWDEDNRWHRTIFTKEQWLAGVFCEDQFEYFLSDDGYFDYWGDGYASWRYGGEEAPPALNGCTWWSVGVTFRWKDKHYPRFLTYEVLAKDEAEALRLARFEARRDGHLRQGRSNVRMEAWQL